MENLEALYAMVYGESTPECRQHSLPECKEYLMAKYPKIQKQFIACFSHESGELIRISAKSIGEIEPIRERENGVVDPDQLEQLTGALQLDPGTINESHTRRKAGYQQVVISLSEQLENLSEAEVLYYFFHERLTEVLDGMKRQLLIDMLDERSEEAVRCMVENIGRVSLQIIEAMRIYPPTSYRYPRRFDHTAIRALIRDTLEKLVKFLARNFEKYTDPALRFTPARPAESNFLDQLDQVQSYGDHLESPVREIVMEPVEQYFKRCSYTQSRYIEAYVAELIRFTSRPIPSVKRWILFIWRMNLNSERTVHFLKRRIMTEQRKCPDLSERKYKLLYYQKLIKQIGPSCPWSFHANRPSLVRQLDDYIQGELLFVEQTADYQIKPVNKKTLKVSVSQLALIARACLESGLIESDKQELLHDLAQGFRTDQQEEISLNNLRNRYYSIDEGTRLAVQKLLRNMLKVIQPTAEK